MPQTIQPFQGSDSEAGVGEFGTDPAADKQWYGCKPNPLVTVVMQTDRPLSLSLTACPCEVAAIFICRHIQRPKMSIFRKKKMALFCVTLARITTSATSWVRMRQRRGRLRHVAGEICEQMAENDTAGPTLLHHGHGNGSR